MQRVISKERGRDFSCVLHAVAIIFFSVSENTDTLFVTI